MSLDSAAMGGQDVFKVVTTVGAVFGGISAIWLLLTAGRGRFLSLTFPAQIGLLAAVLASALVIAGAYLQPMYATSTVMNQALRTPLMPNEQPYRALEAFLLADAAPVPGGRWQQNREQEIENAMNRMSARISELQTPERVLAALPETFLLIGGNSDRRILTSPTDRSFLFQPGFSLEKVGDYAAKDTILITRKQLVEDNPEIALEIASGRVAQDFLATMLANRIDDAGVVQAYFMGMSGTLLIMRAGGRAASYAGKFRATKYFPARPYFWGSFDESNHAGSFDYVSVPYVDYGGNGLVRTYCKAVRLPRNRAAMIAADCLVPGSPDLIEQRIMKYDRKAVKFEVEVVDKTLRPVFPKGSLNGPRANDVAWIKTRIAKANTEEEVSELVGTITTPDSTDQVTSGEILFCIPVGWSTSQTGEDRATLLLARIDSEPAKHSTWLMIVSTLLFGLFTGGVALLIAQYWNTRHEQEVLLRGFASIMQDVRSVPFAWLNERNEFQEVNEAFAEALGYEDSEDLIYLPGHRRRTFRELVREAAAYEEMLDRSLRGENTGPRWWTVRRKDGTWLRVRVHGHGVIVRSARSRDVLHRFGIILDQDSLSPLAMEGSGPKLVASPDSRGSESGPITS